MNRPIGLAALLLAIALAGGAALPPALAWLGRARLHRATVAAMLDAPPHRLQPILPSGAAFAGDARAAGSALETALRGLAAREGALVEQLGPVHEPVPGLIVRHAIVSGNARAILRLVEAIESRSPVVRLSRYRLAKAASGRSLRLEGEFAMGFAVA